MDSDFSGERYVPSIGGDIHLEHVHRYLVARRAVEGKLVLDLDIRTTVEPARPFDVPYNVLDAAKLTAATGWSPLVDFRSGLTRCWSAALARHS